MSIILYSRAAYNHKSIINSFKNSHITSPLCRNFSIIFTCLHCADWRKTERVKMFCQSLSKVQGASQLSKIPKSACIVTGYKVTAHIHDIATPYQCNTATGSLRCDWDFWGPLGFDIQSISTSNLSTCQIFRSTSI